jgi:dCMP deaminase
MTMIALARVIAQRSTCPRRRVGAVATDVHGRVIAVAHNGVAMGEPHCSTERPCAGRDAPSGASLDACLACHAETNLLLFCPDVMKIDTLYVTASPCTLCLRYLLNTSTRRIVFDEEYPHPEARARWLAAGREWVRLGRKS